MKRKSRLCSTGHGTGALQAKSLRKRLGRKWPQRWSLGQLGNVERRLRRKIGEIRARGWKQRRRLK